MTWEEDGFLVIRGFYAVSEDLYKYTLQDREYNEDIQTPGTPAFYNDYNMSLIHKEVLTKVESLTELELFKTYCYYRRYKKGDILKGHIDRPACEISVTMNIGYQGDNWALWILNKDGEPTSIMLEPGDAMIYRGCNLQHGRGVNKNADNFSQVFFHYVDQNGPNAWARDDLNKNIIAEGI